MSKAYKGGHAIETNDGPPRGSIKVTVFLGLTQLSKLDREEMRRKAAGLNVDAEGRRISISRSMLIKEAIDEMPWPETL